MKNGILASSTHFALHALSHQAPVLRKKASAGGLRLGALLPKRFAKRAVTRNLMRRQIYAVGAAYSPQLHRIAQEPQCLDLVLRLRKTFAVAEFSSASSQQLKSAARGELQALFSLGCSRLQSSARAMTEHPASSP